MSVNEVFQNLIAELQGDGEENPLGEAFTLAMVWADLARIANEPVPAEVAKLIDSPPPVRLIRPVLKPLQRTYPCASCGVAIVDDGGVCDDCAGYQESYPCEGCGRPAEFDAETGTAICECCVEEDRERARLVWRLQA